MSTAEKIYTIYSCGHEGQEPKILTSYDNKDFAEEVRSELERSSKKRYYYVCENLLHRK